MRDFVSSLWQVVRPYRVRFFGGIALGMLAGLKDPLLLLAIYFIFEVVFPQAGSNKIGELLEEVARFLPAFADWLGNAIRSLQVEPSLGVALTLFAILPAAAAIGGLSNYGYFYYMQWVAVRSIGDLRAKLYRHLIQMPPGFLQKQSTGELMSRISGDISTLHVLLGNSLVTMIRDPITLVVLIGSQIAFQPALTLKALIILPVAVVPIVIFTRKMKKSATGAQSAQAKVFQSMHEGISGARVVKAYNLEDVVDQDFRGRIKSFNSQYMRMVRAGEIPGPLIEFFGTLGVMGLLASLLFSSEKVTSAEFLTFILAIQMSYTRIKQVVKMVTQVIQARASSVRVFELLNTPSDLPEPGNPVPLSAAGQPIRFENLNFGYDGVTLFKDFNLTVQPGQLVALVGESGSGKTTLTNLLLRFYDPQGGAVKIGDIDIRKVASPELRSQIAVVTQETILFNESVRRNIELGRPGASSAEIEAAARHAHAHDFIMATEHGYDTPIGEKGGN
ncbi:MAG TPA: hypothetical protein DCY13_08185, partial [Verrucomicrobiales bacterium]|nr:hypothetical protein [Verrucomicrobiales bacterium]